MLHLKYDQTEKLKSFSLDAKRSRLLPLHYIFNVNVRELALPHLLAHTNDMTWGEVVSIRPNATHSASICFSAKKIV